MVCACQAEEDGWWREKPVKRTILKIIFIPRLNGEPATLDPVLNNEELSDDEDDPWHVADGEHAHLDKPAHLTIRFL